MNTFVRYRLYPSTLSTAAGLVGTPTKFFSRSALGCLEPLFRRHLAEGILGEPSQVDFASSKRLATNTWYNEYNEHNE